MKIGGAGAPPDSKKCDGKATKVTFSWQNPGRRPGLESVSSIGLPISFYLLGI